MPDPYTHTRHADKAAVSLRFSDAYELGAPDAVERAPDGGPPVAFRIWRAGPNDTDHGPVLFTDRSALAVMADQSARGNLYPFDVDHLSMSPTAPPEARKAVGWHRLEVRGGELWAVDCQWTAPMAAGLAQSPPEWRYYSPVYDTDSSGQIVRYLNTSITNNPQTWNATVLADGAMSASKKDGSQMRFREALDAIKAMAAGDSEDAKLAKAALDAMPASMKDAEPGSDAPGAKSSQPEGEPSSAAGADKKDKKDAEAPASSGPPTAKSAPAPKSDKCDAAAPMADAATAKLAAKVQELAAWKSEREAADNRANRDALYASVGASKELIRTLDALTFKDAKAVCATLPKPARRFDAALAAANGATRGSAHADSGVTHFSDSASRLDSRMGLGATKLGTQRVGNTLILGAPVPVEK